MAKKKHGGKRQGAGRKAVTDKKEPVFIYVKKSIIKKHGDVKAVKAFAEAALEENATNIQR